MDRGIARAECKDTGVATSLLARRTSSAVGVSTPRVDGESIKSNDESVSDTVSTINASLSFRSLIRVLNLATVSVSFNNSSSLALGIEFAGKHGCNHPWFARLCRMYTHPDFKSSFVL